MKLSGSKLANVRAAIEMLTEVAAIVPDGDWADRFVDRLTHEESELAGEAAFEAIQDAEVIIPSQVAVMLCLTNEFNRAAAATALKLVWIDHGFGLPPSLLKAVFNSVISVPQYLMESRGVSVLKQLEDEVIVYRGQLYESGKKPFGASWTLSEEVAQWYSAPAPGSSKRGWVLTGKVPKSAILAAFFERDEQEVVLDLDQLSRNNLSVKRGTCDKFPVHLSKSNLGILGMFS